MSKLIPKYSMWEAINAAISVSVRALEEIRTLARTPGPAGKDGRDGVAYDGIEEEMKDGGRFLVRRHKLNGVVVSEQQFQLGTVLDRGVFIADRKYLAGDGVSFGGSWFIAQEDTTDKPETSKAWRLAVKRGRDGRDGELKAPRESKPVKVG